MNAEDFKHKLTAILSADVQGYSRLMGDNEPETARTLITYREAISNLIQDFHVRVVDSPDDNILAEFNSAARAMDRFIEYHEFLSANRAVVNGKEWSNKKIHR